MVVDKLWLQIKIGIMCRIPGTWHDYSTVNITVEEFCQHRKKKKILTMAVEESCQPLLKNRASDC